MRFYRIGGVKVPSCARCAGSVFYRVADTCGALVELIDCDNAKNRRQRERELLRRAA